MCRAYGRLHFVSARAASSGVPCPSRMSRHGSRWRRSRGACAASSRSRRAPHGLTCRLSAWTEPRTRRRRSVCGSAGGSACRARWLFGGVRHGLIGSWRLVPVRARARSLGCARRGSRGLAAGGVWLMDWRERLAMRNQRRRGSARLFGRIAAKWSRRGSCSASSNVGCAIPSRSPLGVWRS